MNGEHRQQAASPSHTMASASCISRGWNAARGCGPSLEQLRSERIEKQVRSKKGRLLISTASKTSKSGTVFNNTDLHMPGTWPLAAVDTQQRNSYHKASEMHHHNFFLQKTNRIGTYRIILVLGLCIP